MSGDSIRFDRDAKKELSDFNASPKCHIQVQYTESVELTHESRFF